MQRAALIVLSALLVASPILAMVGFSAWPSVVLAMIPWTVLIAGRTGYRLGVVVLLLGMVWGIIATLIVTSAMAVPMALTLAVVFAIAGLAGCVLIVVRGTQAALPSRASLGVGAAASTGAVVWGIAQGISSLLPAPERLSWVMRNDALANLVFARETIYRDGIELGAFANPAPLPSALIALTMQGGRGSVDASVLLEHDLTAMALAWGALIALTCVLSGLVVSSIVSRAGASPRVIAVSAALGSLVVLSWYFTGYPMEYGFVNTHVALPVLLAAFLAYHCSSRAPWAALLAIGLACTAMLAVWSPLVVIPAGLGLALLISRWRAIVSMSRWQLGVVALGIVQFVVYGLVASLPIFLAQRSSLAASGGIHDPGAWVVLVPGVLVIVCSFALQRRFLSLEFLGVAAVVLSAWAGLAFVLFIGRSSPNPWTYYPVKFAWMTSLVFIVILLGELISLCVRFLRTRAARALGVAILGVLVAALMAYAPPTQFFANMNPIDRLLRAHNVERLPEIYETIFEFESYGDATVLWDYAEWGEGDVNIWLIQLWGDSMVENSEVRSLAYNTYFERDVVSLCRLASLMGPELTVYTANEDLENEFLGACPRGIAEFVVK